MKPGPKIKPENERFWSKVRKGRWCWTWTAAFGQGQSGYGCFRQNSPRRTSPAHRVSWTLACGPIPEGKWVLHRCDNPACVRPDHLFLGDHDDNMADMAKKGRAGRSKLTPRQVRMIRSRYAHGGVTNTQLAVTFDLCQAAISNIINRKSYDWVE